ncbi:MAG: LL-diaminopimelate aminotransferase [Myxococcales bacterium]|nr:LL-diaminopimelate aminotransferase [Myxococcales bacterium]
MRINENYQKLQAGYLFPEIGRRVRAFSAENPAANLIRLGIGDVTLPLAPAIVDAIKAATDELGTDAGHRGYGPEQGYDFLVDAIREHDYKARGVDIDSDEIFVSDGSKQDSGNIQEIFSSELRIAVTDPVYPVYVDTNVMAGRTGGADDLGRYDGFIYLPATEANGFMPGPPETAADLVYLCSPNNPTGAVASRENLASWVAWAREHSAVIVFDAAYDAFIRDPVLPRSIYEIDGARECAIEMRSFSKRAGFTGVRCAYTVVPKALIGTTPSGEEIALRDLWSRRHATKFNSVPYPIQRGAEAVFSPEGKRQTSVQVDYYMANAANLRAELAAAGITVFAGEHAPYIWIRTPEGETSWDFFDRLLHEAHVVCTPGSGFGASGEGYARISAFNSRKNVDEAIQRIGRAVGG